MTRINRFGFGGGGDTYGAVGITSEYTYTSPGTSDDSAAINALISSVPPGSTIFLPARDHPYQLTSPINANGKCITIRGSGWKASPVAPFGDSNWLVNGAVIGTVIKPSSNVDAVRMSASPSARFLSIKDLAILGPGTGTGIGLNLGTGQANTNVYTDNVGSFNFVTGCRLSNAIDHTHDRLFVRGCTTGVLIDGSSENGIEDAWFSSFNAEGCGTALDFGGGVNVHIYGGLIQSNTLGIRFAPYNIALANIAQVSLSGIWFENNTGTMVIDTTYGPIARLSFLECRCSDGSTVTPTGSNVVSGLSFVNCEFGGQTLDLRSHPNIQSYNNTGSFFASELLGGTNENVARIATRDGHTTFSMSRYINNSPGSSFTPNWVTSGNVYELLIDQNITINPPTNCPGGSADVTYIIRQDGTGGHNVTLGSGFHGTWSNTGNILFTYSSIMFRQISTGQWVQVGAQSPWSA